MAYITKNEIIAQAEELLKKTRVSEERARKNKLYYSVDKMLKYQSMEELAKTIELLKERVKLREYKTISGEFNYSKLGKKIFNLAEKTLNNNQKIFLDKIRDKYITNIISIIKENVCSEVKLEENLDSNAFTLNFDDLNITFSYYKKYTIEENVEYYINWEINKGLSTYGKINQSTKKSLQILSNLFSKIDLEIILEKQFKENLELEKHYGSLQNELLKITDNAYEYRDNYKEIINNNILKF